MSSLFGQQSSAASANPTQGDLKNDVAVNNPPEDGISDIRFSPAAEYLAASSWDKKVRIWEVDGNGNTQGRALFEHEGPVLSCCWSPVSTIPHVPLQSRRTIY
jgi:mRNA export factor